MFSGYGRQSGQHFGGQGRQAFSRQGLDRQGFGRQNMQVFGEGALEG